MDKTTRILINLDLANKLAGMKKVGDTYTTIIQRLLDFYENAGSDSEPIPKPEADDDPNESFTKEQKRAVETINKKLDEKESTTKAEAEGDKEQDDDDEW